MLSATDPLMEEEDVASMAELLGVTSGEYRRRMVLSQVTCGSLKAPDCPPGVPDEECDRASDEWMSHMLEQFDCQKAFVIGIRVPGRNDRTSLAQEWRRRWERAQAICPVPELLRDGAVPKAGEAAWTACRERVLHGKPQ
jgi:hypothetical protein